MYLKKIFRSLQRGKKLCKPCENLESLCPRGLSTWWKRNKPERRRQPAIFSKNSSTDRQPCRDGDDVASEKHAIIAEDKFGLHLGKLFQGNFRQTSFIIDLNQEKECCHDSLLHLMSSRDYRITRNLPVSFDAAASLVQISPEVPPTTTPNSSPSTSENLRPLLSL